MAEKSKKSFIVYYDWKETLSFFSDAEIGEMFKGLFLYAETGTMPEFSNKSLDIAFSFMKSAIDRDQKAYKARCEKNKINGKKGGRPENPKKPNGFSENPTKPKKADNDNDSDSGTENENENEIDIDSGTDSGTESGTESGTDNENALRVKKAPLDLSEEAPPRLRR